MISFTQWLLKEAENKSGSGLLGTGTPFKYTPSNSNLNPLMVTKDQWYKIDNKNKFQAGCSGLPCPSSLKGGAS